VSGRIQAHPNEVDPTIPFEHDRKHASYDPRAVWLFRQQLVQAHRVMSQFRSSFVGNVSPVHFFWGGFDLACTRFSGRTAPPHPGGAPNCADWVMVEGYSHELSSCGFWPGGGDEGAFYSYAYPEPEGFADSVVEPVDAFCSKEHQEFVLPYEAVRTASDPDAALLRFLDTTYRAAAERGNWNRTALETDPHRWDTGRRTSVPGARRYVTCLSRTVGERATGWQASPSEGQRVADRLRTRLIETLEVGVLSEIFVDGSDALRKDPAP
jgi:Family of unknown function (DUF5996)